MYDIATGRHKARIERKADSDSGARGKLGFTPDGQQIVAPETDSTAAGFRLTDVHGNILHDILA